MEALYSLETARLVGGLPHDEYLVISGRVQSLETVYQLIETLDNSERQINEHRSKSADTKQRAATQRDLTFAGSPYWDRTRSKP